MMTVTIAAAVLMIYDNDKNNDHNDNKNQNRSHNTPNTQ